MSSNLYRLTSSFWTKTAVALATMFAVVFAPFANTLPAFAATGINRQISYQAKLLDTSGSPVADGTYSVKLSVYDAAAAGTRLWTATGTTILPTALSVNVVSGLFTVNLGDTSVAGGTQNALDDTILWNSDSLYLGVTIDADAEMAPRKRLTASPYAFNAERLQGMYASTSAFGASTVFTLNQASNTAATGTRSTLDVRSQGTSNANDFLIRAINDTDTAVFTVNRQGNTTSTNATTTSFFATTASSTNLTALNLTANTVTLLGGTAVLSAATSTQFIFTNATGTTLNLATLTATNGTVTNATSTNFSTTNLTWTAATGTSVTSTNFFSTNITGTSASLTSLLVSGQSVCLANGTNCLPGGSSSTPTLQQVLNQGNTATTTMEFGGGTSTGNFVSTNLNVTGTGTFLNLFATNATTTSVTSTYLASLNASTTYAYIYNLQNQSINTEGIVSTGNINSESLIVTATSSLADVTITNGTTTNATSTNLFVTNSRATNSTSTNSTSTNLFATNAAFTNLSLTNVTTTNFFSTTASSTNLTALNLNANNVTVLGGTAVFSASTSTNATSTNLFATNIVGTNATFTNLGLSNVTTTNLFSTTVSSTNLTALNLNANTVTILGGTATFSSSTSTEFYAAFATGTSYSLTDFSNPRVTNHYSIPNDGTNFARSIAVDKNRIYIAKDSTGIFYFDTKNPDAPVFLGSSGYTVFIKDLFVSENYLYAAGLESMLIFDLRRQGDIASEISGSAGGTVGTGNYGIFVQGDYAYIAASTTGMKIVDVSNKSNPRLISTIATPGAASKVTVSGNYAYVAHSGVGVGGVSVIDIRNPVAPVLVASTSNGDEALDVAVQGNRIYVAAGVGGLTVYDNTDPTAPALLTGLSTIPANSFQGITISGRYGYISMGVGGLQVIDISITDIGVPPLILDTAVGNTNVRDSAVSGRNVYYIDEGLYSYALPSARMAGADIASLQTANALVTQTLNVGGLLSVQGGLSAGSPSEFSDGLAINSTSSYAAAAMIKNRAATSTGSAWGAYINTLLVGATSTATGTADFVSVFNYNGSNLSGLCLDNLDTAETCLTGDGISISSDDAINASAFDLAEWYQVTGSATATDLLIVDNSTSTKLKVSDGTPYDSRLIGIASTKPGFLLGDTGDVKLALAGRVPTKFSAINGSVVAGDFLTSSPFPGYAMKATKPGMIVGYALEAAAATSTIEVFVKPGYSAGTVLSVVGNDSVIKDNLVFVSPSTATVGNQAVDSFGLTFRGSAWNAASSTAISSDFNWFNNVINATNSQLTLTNASGTNLFTVSQSGDVSISGRFFPATRSGAQSNAYLFVDDTQGPTSTYITTNADGWQTNDTYDFAERYYSPEPLEAGEVVTLSQTGQFHVQRAASTTEMTMGIVSTRPGFVTGRPASSTYPIALAGRVPTKVSSMNGAIHIGDPLGPSTIPGVAVKVTQQGPMIGYAMEEYSAAAVGLIEVFVEGGWYGKKLAEDPAPVAPIINNNTTIINQVSTSHKGFAKIAAGAKKVTVTFATLNAFPNVQVQPRGQVLGGYYTDDYTDVSFTINMNEAQTRDVTFSWLVTATTDGDQVFLSDGTTAPLNTMTGETIAPEVQPAAGSELVEESEEPVTEPTLPEAPTSTEEIIPLELSVSTSTEMATSTQE